MPQVRYRRFVLLDRDGVINVERGDHILTREDWVWAPGTFEGLRLLREEGFGAIVVTNQSCIGRGLQTERRLAELHDFMCRSVAKAGGDIVKVYHCPHMAEDGCACRKPAPGMLLRAADEFGIDLAETFLIGDAARDIEAAQAVGARTIMIKNGWNAPANTELATPPDFYAENLEKAARIVVAESGR
jgi:D-glycero-D-manno-heptose 1,7-bisphosphate phosphatase